MVRVVRILAAAIAGTFAANAQRVDLFYDAASGPAAFAASEIRKAHASKGAPLAEHGLDALASNAATLRLVIAAGPTASQQISSALGVVPMKATSAQAYS